MDVAIKVPYIVKEDKIKLQSKKLTFNNGRFAMRENGWLKGGDRKIGGWVN